MAADLTPEVLAELARLDREATPGPWEALHSKGAGDDHLGWVEAGGAGRVAFCDHCDPCGSAENCADKHLIAIMRNALPALLAAARREARLREALRGLIGKADCHCSGRLCVCGFAGRLREADAALAYDGKEE